MPTRITSILAAVVPGKTGLFAFQQAVRMALFFKARLIAISITPRYEGNMNRWKIDNAEEQFNKPFLHCLDEAQQIAGSHNLEVHTMHKVGDPVEEILYAAEEQQADIVILGYPKRSRIERVILGNTAAKVIGYSPCDVMMIPYEAEIDFSRILVGIDGSSYSMAAGQRALELGLAFGGDVYALTVIDIPVERGFLYGVLDEARRRSYPPLQTLVGQGERLGVRVITDILEGSPYATIVRHSETNSIGLIVLGSHGRTEFGDLLMGSVVERVTSMAALPTLVVKRR